MAAFRKGIALLVLAVVAAALAATAQAGVAGVSPSLRVSSAEKTGVCAPAGQAYTVHTIVTVANGNTVPITIVKSDWSAKGKSPSGDFTADAALTSDGGLTGSTVPAHTTHSYRVDVATIVPCDATSAQVCVVLTVDKNSATGTTDSKCATFIASGKTVVPTGTIGLLGLTFVLGGALVVAQMVSRRRKRVELR
jgi:hypothetical protein